MSTTHASTHRLSELVGIQACSTHPVLTAALYRHFWWEKDLTSAMLPKESAEMMSTTLPCRYNDLLYPPRTAVSRNLASLHTANVAIVICGMVPPNKQ